MFISFSWKHGTICVENPPIVANYYCSSSVCIYEHAASEIETYQNVMTVPIKAVLQVAVHIICHQMGDAIIVAIVVQWSWVVHRNCQLGEARILQAEFFGYRAILEGKKSSWRCIVFGLHSHLERWSNQTLLTFVDGRSHLLY